MDLSVIVASYNTSKLLQACLESIYATTRGLEFEVIVVDDCSTDGSPEMVRMLFPQVHLIVNPQNMRYAKTNNVGLKAARGRYGLLLNSDVEVHPGAFSGLVAFMDLHPEAAAAGPKLISPDGSIQQCIRSFPGKLYLLFQALSLHKIWPQNPFTGRYYNTAFDYNRSQAVQSIGTTCFIIRRSIWENYGMLDERLTLAFVDLAYCYGLREQKQNVYYIHNVTVMHYGSQSINQNGLKEIRLMNRDLRKFYDIYLAAHDNWGGRVLVRAGIALRLWFKIFEYELSSDKRVFSGPGVPGGGRKPIKR